MKLGIRGKLILLFTVVLVLAIGSIGAGSYIQSASMLETELKQQCRVGAPINFRSGKRVF